MKDKITSVVCSTISFDDKILTVQKSTKMTLPLKWEFLTGKTESGASEIECIKREIFEELNIKIELKKRLTSAIHQYPNYKAKLIPFTAEYLSGELQLIEHSQYILAYNKELINLDWAEADLPILKEFIEL